MKLEYSVILVLSFGLVGVLLWYVLSIIPIDFAKEYSLLVFFVLTIGYLTFLIHGKGILYSPKNVFDPQQSKDFRNGLIYQRTKFRLKNIPLNKLQLKDNKQKVTINKKIHSFDYSRKKFRN